MGNAVLTVKGLSRTLKSSSGRLRRCDVFLLKALPPEKKCSPARPSKARAATGMFPDRKARCCKGRYSKSMSEPGAQVVRTHACFPQPGQPRRILDFSLQTSSGRLCRRGIFLFSRFPCCGRFSISPQKLPPVRPTAAEIFFAALFRRLSHPKELKQKREGTPKRRFLPSTCLLQSTGL